MSNGMQARQQKLSQCVTFILGDEVFAVNVGDVREVLRYTEVASVPGAASAVLGIINLRGIVVPVIDAGRAMRRDAAATEPTVTEATRIVIVDGTSAGMDDNLGILVDGVAEVTWLDLETLDPAPAATLDQHPWLCGICQHEGLLVQVILLPALLAAVAASEGSIAR